MSYEPLKPVDALHMVVTVEHEFSAVLDQHIVQGHDIGEPAVPGCQSGQRRMMHQDNAKAALFAQAGEPLRKSRDLCRPQFACR